MTATLRVVTLWYLLCLSVKHGVCVIEGNATDDAVGSTSADGMTACKERRSDHSSATEVLLEQHSQAISSLQAELAALRAKTDKLSNVVVFTAKGVASTDLQHGDVVIFTNVITDVGHAYDVTQGTFLAPVAGIYYVYVRADPVSDLSLKMTVMVNTKDFINVYGDGGVGGVGVYLSLSEGDRLWVKFISGTIEGACLLSVGLIAAE